MEVVGHSTEVTASRVLTLQTTNFIVDDLQVDWQDLYLKQQQICSIYLEASLLVFVNLWTEMPLQSRVYFVIHYKALSCRYGGI